MSSVANKEKQANLGGVDGGQYAVSLAFYGPSYSLLFIFAAE